MPANIYLETSVIRHLTDPPSDNPITHACQQLTRLWWHTRCDPHRTFISGYVITDLEDGDPLRVMRRTQAIQHLVKYKKYPEVASIAELLVLGGGLRAKAIGCAEHIACAAYNQCDVLLTWNCKDIANAQKFPLLRLLMNQRNQTLPELVTPFELMENCYENLWGRNPC